MPRGLLFPIRLALASVSKLSCSHLSICLLHFVSVSISVSDPLGHDFNRHIDTGPGPHPVICAPRPTALSVSPASKGTLITLMRSGETRALPSGVRTCRSPQPSRRRPLGQGEELCCLHPLCLSGPVSRTVPRVGASNWQPPKVSRGFSQAKSRRGACQREMKGPRFWPVLGLCVCARVCPWECVCVRVPGSSGGGQWHPPPPPCRHRHQQNTAL